MNVLFSRSAYVYTLAVWFILLIWRSIKFRKTSNFNWNLFDKQTGREYGNRKQTKNNNNNKQKPFEFISLKKTHREREKKKLIPNLAIRTNRWFSQSVRRAHNLIYYVTGILDDINNKTEIITEKCLFVCK